jgi:hypothetical protein
MSQATFAAKKTFSSGELLALKRQQVERAQTRPPSIHLQDSSELTARVRKMAAVLPSELPSQGNSTNMVKWRDCSVVQAMKEGQSYRTSAVNREPRTDKNTCCQVPIPFLRPDFLVATTPKAIGCARVIEEEQRVIEPFDLAQHFGMRKNDNKGVISRYPAFVDGTCMSCDAPYRNCIPSIHIRPFDPFKSSDWSVNGNSLISGSSIVLMTNASGRSGSAFYNTNVIDITKPFTLTATVTLRASSSGEPGNGFCIAFVTNPSFLGVGGGDTGFFESSQGFHGYALYVDTYATGNGGSRKAFLIDSTHDYNTRVSGSDGNITLSSAVSTGLVNTTTGGATVTLTYDGITLTAVIALLSDPTKTATVSANINLSSRLNNSRYAYFGATAGSGSAYQLTTLTDIQYDYIGTC